MCAVLLQINAGIVKNLVEACGKHCPGVSGLQFCGLPLIQGGAAGVRSCQRGVERMPPRQQQTGTNSFMHTCSSPSQALSSVRAAPWPGVHGARMQVLNVCRMAV